MSTQTNILDVVPVDTVKSDESRPAIPGREMDAVWTDEVNKPISPCGSHRWSASMSSLLSDSEGVALFKRYLESRGYGNTLDFWFACQGFKYGVDSSDSAKIYQLIKAIVRTYIRGCGVSDTTSTSSSDLVVHLKSSTRKSILDRLTRKHDLNQTIFDEAQAEIETEMRSSTYPDFLQTTIYKDYVLNCGDLSTFTSNPDDHENISISSKNVTRSGDTSQECLTPAASLTTENLIVSSQYRKELSDRCGSLYNNCRWSRDGDVPLVTNPYHLSYVPVSAQDSCLDSRSSEAATEDTFSRTDSSHDGGVDVSKRGRKPPTTRLSRLARSSMKHSAFSSQQNHPTSELFHRTQAKQKSLAEKDPQTFASILKDRLTKVANYGFERKDCGCNRLGEINDDPSGTASAPCSLAPLPLSLDPSNTLHMWMGNLMAAARASSSVGPEDDPDSILDDHCSRVWDKQTNEKTFIQPRHSSSSRVVGSTASYDSGVTPDFYSEHRHVHHYHYHHKPTPIGHPPHANTPIGHPPHSNTPNIPTPGKTLADPAHLPDLKVTKTRSRASDTSSNIDSGVSMVYDKLNTSTNDKVLHWIMENDPSPSHNAAPVPLHHWVTRQASITAASKLLPRQPGCMPPLPPPDPTTQLLEAQRRLVMHQGLAKSRSFSVAPVPEPVHRDVNISNCSTLSETKSDRAPSPPPLSSESGLTIGYYLCGDPVPYRTHWPHQSISLGQFKHLIAKKANYRFFFKKACDEFDTGVVQEEVTNDDEILPIWEGKVVAKVMKNE